MRFHFSRSFSKLPVGISTCLLCIYLTGKPNAAQAQQNHDFYFFSNIIENGFFGIGYVSKNRYWAEANTGISVVYTNSYNAQTGKSNHEFWINPFARLEIGVFLIRCKRPFTGLFVNSFWNYIYKHHASPNRWLFTNFQIPIINLQLGYRRFFGKSNFYWEIYAG